MGEFLVVCKDCALFNGSGFYLAYGLLVLAASITKFRSDSRSLVVSIEPEHKRFAPFAGDLSEVFAIRSSISSYVLHVVLGFVSFAFFAGLVRQTVRFIRAAFMMGDHPS